MIKNLTYISILAFTLSACGGGGTETSSDRVMDIGESYTVSKGDMIVKVSDEALVKIIHKSGEEISTVSLIEGNATITHTKQK